MEREIKFRAWDTFNEYMYKSVDVNNNKKDLSWFFRQCEEAGKGGNGIIIMQYTGLKDKNGKEIYDGDIILNSKATEPENKGWIIKWINLSWKVELIGYEDAITGFSDRIFNPFYNTQTEFEIIGNIYENAELIK